jgi:hypothetical protein
VIPDHIARILGKGLKFIPMTPKPIINMDIFNSYQKILNTNILMAQVKPKSTKQTFIPKFYVKNPFWNPPHNNMVSFFLKRVFKELEVKYTIADKILKQHYNPSLDTTILKIFKKHQKLMVISTDKNLGLAIIHRDDYQKMCLEHLEDKTTYLKVDLPTEEIIRMTRQTTRPIVKLANLHYGGDIKKLAEFLDNSFNDTIMIPYFHCIAKIHKFPIKGRPIAGAVNWVTTPISKLLSHILHPIVEEKRSILKDSSALIRVMDGIQLNQEDILVTMDITSLYPNMDQEMTLQCVDNAMLSYPIHIRKFAVEATKLVLCNSFVQFNGHIYRQVKGMAMGTNAAVELANLYVDFIVNRSEIFKRFPEVQYYYRYIDDLFFIWKGGNQHRLDECLNDFNNIHKSLKFTHTVSQSDAIFLDLNVMKDQQSRIVFKVFQKPINKYLYLTYDFNHPKATKAGFIKGELIRYVRNCSREEDYEKIKTEFIGRLLKRGYTMKFINRSMKNVLYSSRNLYLDKSLRTPVVTKKPVIMTIPYHPMIEAININASLHNHWKWLPIKNSHKPMVAFTNAPSIEKLVTTSIFESNKCTFGP